jgi:hypothetical protein
LAISHVKGAAFCFLMSLLFFVFLLFASYGIWCVVLHGMMSLKSKVDGGTLFRRFFFWCDTRFVRGKKEGAW